MPQQQLQPLKRREDWFVRPTLVYLPYSVSLSVIIILFALIRHLHLLLHLVILILTLMISSMDSRPCILCFSTTATTTTTRPLAEGPLCIDGANTETGEECACGE